MMTDASLGGIGGVVAQGPDWKSAKVAAFFSAKLNPAQRNYAVHEREVLAGIETMRRHRDILQGAHFVWLTDHKALTYLLNQRDLPGRLARWFVTEFDFEVQYIAGAENILPDALSRMYAFDAPGTERSPSEYTEFDTDVDDNGERPLPLVSMPLLVGAEALASVIRRSTRVPVTPRQRDASPEGGLARPGRVAGRATNRPGGICNCVEQPAETGRPETAKEFARRVKDHFVLLGPGERKKGGKGGDTHHPDDAAGSAETSRAIAPGQGGPSEDPG
jgi:hypothetical protein